MRTCEICGEGIWYHQCGRTVFPEKQEAPGLYIATVNGHLLPHNDVPCWERRTMMKRLLE